MAAIWYEYVLFHDKQILFFMYMYIKIIYKFADIADFQYFLVAILEFENKIFTLSIHIYVTQRVLLVYAKFYDLATSNFGD